MVTLDQCGWLGPRARLLPVGEPLHDLVEHASIIDMRSIEADSWLVVPDRAAYLLVQILEGRGGTLYSRSSVVGPRTVAVSFPVRRRCWTVCVRLRPGALRALGGPPGGDLLDRSTSLGSVWGRVGGEAARRIESASAPEEVLRHTLAFVAGRASAHRPRGWMAASFDRALAASLELDHGRGGIHGIAETIGTSPRTLRRSIARETGLTPMRHLRIQRLYDAATRLRDDPESTVSRIAPRCGYADQAHLARDFVDLMGEPPTEYRRRGRVAESYKTSDPGRAHLR